jgi:hypothetical protein
MGWVSYIEDIQKLRDDAHFSARLREKIKCRRAARSASSAAM